LVLETILEKIWEDFDYGIFKRILGNYLKSLK
jgi:hypothetical protein